MLLETPVIALANIYFAVIMCLGTVLTRPVTWQALKSSWMPIAPPPPYASWGGGGTLRIFFSNLLRSFIWGSSDH